VATETVEYLLREMQHREGGFFSSQDADSEGVEGRFFTWSWEELVDLVGEPVAACFGATAEGNWAGEDGRTNVLWRPIAISAVAREHGLDPTDLEAMVEHARTVLFEARNGRVHPGTDDKVLTAWNAMAIRALAEAGRAFDEPRYIEAATRCASFVMTHLRDEGGRLLRSWRNGVAGGPAFCEDHAQFASACLTLYETTHDLAWFTAARDTADAMVRLFADAERGGFFVTGSDADALVVRPKDLQDNAVPSGNSVAAEVLLRLSHLTGEASYEEAGASALRLVRDVMSRVPTGFGHALCALDLVLGPVHEVAIVGPVDSPATRALTREVTVRRYLPNAVLAVAGPEDDGAREAVALLADREARDGRPTAYVCEHFTCKLPVTAPEDLAAQLASAGSDGLG
jgi:uncharacterized protein YyaL (SSP411 family)